MIGQLTFNEESGRIEMAGDGLHSEQPLKVLIVNEDGETQWIDTQLECSHNRKAWYLDGLWGYQVNGLFAKFD